MNTKCPHLNCLVYHPNGVCNCNMSRYCDECKKESKINTPQYKCQSWHDRESKSVRDCTCGKCAKRHNKDTKQIIQNMEKEFDEKFVRFDGEIDEYGDVVMDFIKERIPSLLTAFAEEVVGENEYRKPFDLYQSVRNDAKQEQRLKAKEIIENIKL